MRTERGMRTTVANVNRIVVKAGILLMFLPCPSSWAQANSGDHLWNFRQNADDRFHSNEAWVRPWRYNHDDGWGRWVGGYSYELQWGPVSTIGNADGSFTISRSRDHQFHAWTYVYVANAKTITYNGGGDCVPRVFLNYAFDSPMEFPTPLNLVSGWSRIDVTGYNQNSGYTFSCAGLANLVDIMNTSEFSVKNPPVANAGGSYGTDEGSAVPFNGSASYDPDGDALEFRWEFDGDGVWDTGWSSDPTASHTYGDNWTGIARLDVRDSDSNDVDTADVTVNNVAPTASIDSVSQPTPQFILPNHALTFTGSFIDPGWLDTHTCTWDFDDGTTTAGTLTEEHDPPDATGATSAQHAYASPRTYAVTMIITDDDGGVSTSAPWSVTVVSGADLIQALGDYIQGLPDSAFDKQPAKRKDWFQKKLDAVTQAIAGGDYSRAIRELQRIRSKADGSIDGNPKDDRIVDPVAQQHICAMIDDLIAYLQSL